MFRTDLLTGKRILITGGGSGLGAAMAARFAELGATLHLAGRRENVLAATAESITQASGRPVHTHVCDVRDADAVDRTIDAIFAIGPLDILVNNAAANFVARSESLSMRAVNAVIGATMNGAIHCTWACGRRWISQQRRGVVLSILSTSTITGRAFTTPSSIAKSGVLAMTRSLAVEWGPRGIRLAAIAPGPFPTPGAWARLRPGDRDKSDGGPAARNPLGRVGEHIELANLASYLVSDEAGYINGEMVTIDGGAHLRTSGAEDLLGWTDEQWQAIKRGEK